MQLDGEVELRPVAVDLVALSIDVRAGAGQAVTIEQRRKPVSSPLSVASEPQARRSLAAPFFVGLRAMQASIRTGVTR